MKVHKFKRFLEPREHQRGEPHYRLSVCGRELTFAPNLTAFWTSVTCKNCKKMGGRV